MKFHPLNTVFIVCGLLKLEAARTLQIFNGTLTEITCSAAIPLFRVMEQGLVYAYDQLPDLFDIEAKFSAGNNVTLYINGTDRSNNVTVTCGYTDLFSARFQVLFTLTLEFVSILPAPNDVHYNLEDPADCLQISWEPPTFKVASDELGSQSVRVDFRITHHIIYITNESTTTVYNASGTSFAIGTDKIPCSFWFQVAAVNPAGVGERSPSQIATFTSWAISATTIAALLAIVCVILAAYSFTMLKKYHCDNGINLRHSKTIEKEIEMKQNEVYGIGTTASTLRSTEN